MGIPRKVDSLGRVVLPVELRRELDIKEGDLVSVDQDGPRLLISRVDTYCIFCGSRSDLVEHRGRMVCGACLAELRTPPGEA